MARLAWKNLIQDRSRLAVMLIGVTLAVVLMLIQSGLYFGYMQTCSSMIDYCPGDFWVVPEGTMNGDAVMPFPEEVADRVRAVPGVAWAEGITHGWAAMKLPDGAMLWGQVVGFNPDSRVGAPREIVTGRITDLHRPGTYFVDEASLPLLQGARVGDILENSGQRMELVGVSRGRKSSSTYPILYSSADTAQDQTWNLERKIQFVVAGLAPGADREEVRWRLESLGHYDIHTPAGYSDIVRSYWARKTGIGLGIGTTMVLGFLVGLVIAGQTMYASTVERIREYATLKAMGATNCEVSAILWTQAGIISVVGYICGSLLASLFQDSSAAELIAIVFTPWTFVLIFIATVIMCFLASLLSVLRLFRLDPATVFRTG